MTAAVCLKCGEMKRGAWTACRACGHEPKGDEEFTKSLLLSDHFARPEDLAGAAARIKKGEPVSFDEQTLKDHWVTQADVKRAADQAGRFIVGCLALLVGLLVALYLLLQR